MAKRILRFRGTQLADELLYVIPPEIVRGGQPIMHSTLAADVKTSPTFDSANTHRLYGFIVISTKTSDVAVAILVQQIGALMGGKPGMIEVFNDLSVVDMTISEALLLRVRQPPAGDPASGRLAEIEVTFTSTEPIR